MSIYLATQAFTSVKGDSCLQLATAEAIDQRVITGYYAKPTNHTSIGISVGVGGHEALLNKCIHTKTPLTSERCNHTVEPPSADNYSYRSTFIRSSSIRGAPCWQEPVIIS